MSKRKIKHLKFPITFDVDKLKSDLEKATQFSWKKHYVEDNYDGDWSLIPLISPGGTIENTFAMANDGAKPAPTDILRSCPYFESILNDFTFPVVSARLMRLAAGSYIKPHTDHCLGYEDGSFRLHIPIVTNPDLEFILGGEKLVMAEGSLWYINANYEHSVANQGNTDRVHLVIDGDRNEGSDKLFLSVAHREDFIPPEPEYTSEEKKFMIENFKAIGTPAAMEMAEKLMKEISE